MAGEMRSWPEFVAGHEYTVDLKSMDSAETVSVRLVENGDERYVRIRGEGVGHLYDRVLGRAIYALAAHSDHLMVDRFQ